MGELAIRRNRGFAVSQYQKTDRTEKAADSGASQKVTRATVTVSQTLQQLMTKFSQAESHIRESRRTLQTGEGVLAEVRDRLDRIGELAQKSAEDGSLDRTALQEEFEGLREEIDRMINGALSDGVRLFLDEDVDFGDGTQLLLHTLMGETAAGQEVVLPDWLTYGITQGSLDVERLLAGLGLDKNADISDILSAIENSSLEGGSAAGCLAALYLGAVIAGGADSGKFDPTAALEGLRRLLDQVSAGVPLDRAIALLTDGKFTSLSDFQEQFTGGVAPGLREFLVNLLLSDSGAPPLDGSPLLGLLAKIEGMNLELMMGLLSAVQSPEANPEMEAQGGADQPVGTGSAGPAMSTSQFGSVQVTGRDLSAVSLSTQTGELLLRGAEDVTLQGVGQQHQAILVSTDGKVTLQHLNTSVLTVNTPSAHLISQGDNALAEVWLQQGASLTLSGGGLLKIGLLRGDGANTLRLTEGTAVMVGEAGQTSGALEVPVLLDGPVSLAARAGNVHNFAGKPLEPFDLVWKTLLSGWRSLSTLALDGRQTRMALLEGTPARLWLEKGDPSHGYPVHTLLLRGKDHLGHPQTRYAYLRWNQPTASFQEIAMYPNPFTITGGEQGRDWVYEEETHTLRILSDQVSAISGGAGTDAAQAPFSGRLALADGIGPIQLSLGGVVCRVASGRAFQLGRENRVALILENGASNIFESGVGCAGISLGDGTSLQIDGSRLYGGSRNPAGTLTAVGGEGGAGIGRDSTGTRDRNSHILIRGGVITASGTGGGAGIGAGKHGAMGTITVLGGVITSTGGTGGGAGIGGALGAPVGDISIRGGTVTAAALHHAAAIGAGVQGECGNILITGTARIVKAQGGNPGADIGACLFGGCGEVSVSGSADIGGAKLWTQSGVSLNTGAGTVTLPQFRLSSRALQLDKLSVSTQANAQQAETTIDADQRWVSQIQAVYHALYHQLEQGPSSLYGFRRYAGNAGRPVRDTADASSLLQDMRQSILLQADQAMRTHGRRGKDAVGQLLQ